MKFARMTLLVSLVVQSAFVLPSSKAHAIGECFDFRPGVNYLNVAVTPSDTPEAFGSPTAYGLLSVFSEQIALNILSESDASLQKYIVSDLGKAVGDAVGVGQDATMLFSPIDPPSKNDTINISYVPTEKSIFFAASPTNMYFTKGFLRNIAMSTVSKVFSDIDGYKKHLVAVNNAHYEEIYRVNDLEYPSGTTGQVPVGLMLFAPHAVVDNNAIADVRRFSLAFIGKLLFLAGHEMGHIKLGHTQRKPKTCEEFQERELAADQLAAEYVSQFLFRMVPDEADKSDFVDFSSFFADYDEYGFSGKGDTLGCKYPDISRRSRDVLRAAYRETVRLRLSTYSYPDYSTANPTSAICQNGEKRWRIMFSDKYFLPLDEIRERSIEMNSVRNP